jgi:predicted RND superfamily exporter protein
MSSSPATHSDRRARPRNIYADGYARFVLKHRWAFIILMFASTIYTGFYVKDVNLRNDPDSLLPLTNRYIATNLYSELSAGMGNLMVWGVKVREGDIFQPWFIRMLHEMYNDVSRLDYANPENFVGIPSSKLRNLGVTDDGSLDFKRLIPYNGLSSNDVEAAEQIAYLKEGLRKHPVMEALLVYYEDANGNKCHMLDENGLISNETFAYVHDNCTAKGTFIIGDFGNELKDHHIAWITTTKAQLADYEERYGDRVEFLISGEPYFLASMVQEVDEKSWLFAISLLIVLLVLWYEFRHWSCAVLPLLGVGMTIIMTLGLMGITQFKLTTMMILTPMLLLAIGIGHSMQITRRFMQELHKSGGDTEVAAFESIRYTIVPASLSIGTDLHGFFAISFVDISFYKAYAYFGIFGMSTLIFTTTTLIPLMMIVFPPKLKDHEDERGWERKVGQGIARMLTGPMKWIPVAIIVAVLWASAHYSELWRGIDAIMSGDEGRKDPEVARIQDEFDIMPGAEKGINYPRAAFKDEYFLDKLFGGSGEVRPIADLEKLSHLMPGVITANMVIRSRAGTLAECDDSARNEDGERILGPDKCYDPIEDPPQGIFNDAQVLKALSDFEDWLRRHPNIGYSVSYIQFVKTLNMMLNAPAGEEPMEHMNLYTIPTQEHIKANWYAYKDPDDPEYVPDSNRLVQFYNGLLVSNTSSGELDSFINVNSWDEGTIIGFVNTMDPVESHRTIVDIQNYLYEHRDDPGMRKLKVGIEGGETIKVKMGTGVGTIVTDTDVHEDKAAIGGFLGVTEATRDVAFKEWIHAPIMTSATVFAMTAIMFRSWMIAFILISLCFITLMSQYGLAGYMTSIKEWSANLAFHVQVALSIAMGLGIDYSVYMVSRLQEEMRATNQNWRQALENTLSTTGSAILISVIVLLGSLIPLMNTELANTWSISLYIGEALILDVITALMFLPLLIYWIKPRFVFERHLRVATEKHEQ